MMKKIGISLLVFATASLYAHAQLSIGIKGGLSYGGINIKNVDYSVQNCSGYNFGIFSSLKISRFAFQVEALAMRQGSRYTPPKESTGQGSLLPSSGLPPEVSNYDYFAIPMLVKLYPFKRFKLNVYAGLQVGILANINEVWDEAGGKRAFGDDAKKLIKDLDTSLGAGIGYDFPFGLSLDVRYNHGLDNIYKGEGLGGQSPYLRHQLFQFNLSFAIVKFLKILGGN